MENSIRGPSKECGKSLSKVSLEENQMPFLLGSTNPFKKLAQDSLQNLCKNKNVLIVGGTAGIGKALAISLLQNGAQVTIVGRRDPDISLSKAKFIRKDLSLMKTAQTLAEDIDASELDIVVFTNGIICFPQRKETEEGIEMDLAVSYLSRMAILKKIAPVLGTKRSDLSFKPRVFIMGYPGKKAECPVDDFNSEKSYSAIPAHMATVVGNECLVEYTSNLNSSINVFGLNPGLIYTEIRDNYLGKGTWASWFAESIIKLVCKSAESYASNVLVHLMVSPVYETEKNNTLFDCDGSELKPNPFIVKDDHRAKVVSASEALLEKALSK